MEHNNTPITNFAKRTWAEIQNKGYQVALLLGEDMEEDTMFFAGKGLAITQGNIQLLTAIAGRFDLIFIKIDFHELNKETLKQAFDHLQEMLNPNGTIYVRGRSTQDAKLDTGTDRHFQYITKEELEESLRAFHNVKVDSTSLIQNDMKSHFLEAVATKSLA